MDRRPDLSPRASLVLMLLVLSLGAGLRIAQFLAPFGSDEPGQRSALHAIMARQLIERGTLTSGVNPTQSFDAGYLGSWVLPTTHAPTATWAVAGSFLLFGDHDWAARLPFMLASILGLYYAYRLGVRIDGRTGGVVAALCLATLPAAVLFGADVAPFGSLLLLSSLGLTDAYCSWSERHSRLDAINLFIWLVAAVASDWSGLILWLSLLVHALSSRLWRRERFAVSTGVGMLIVGLAAFWIMAAALDHPQFDSELNLEHFIRMQVEDRLTPSSTPIVLRFVSAQLKLYGIVLLIIVSGWFVLAIRAPARQHAIPFCLWMFAGAFYVAEAFAGFRGSDVFHPVAAAYMAAVVAALSFLRMSPGRTLWLAVMLAGANLASVSSYANRYLSGPDSMVGPNTNWQLAEFAAHIPRHDSVLLDEGTDAATALYYLDRSVCVIPSQRSPRVPTASADSDSRPRDSIVRHRWSPPGADQNEDLHGSQMAAPDWLLTKRDLDRPLGSLPAHCVGDWRLYRLALRNGLIASVGDNRAAQEQAVLSARPGTVVDDASTIAADPPAALHDGDAVSSAASLSQMTPDSARPFRFTRDWTLNALQQFLVVIVLVSLVALRGSRTGLCTSLRKRLQRLLRPIWMAPVICGMSAVLASGALAALTSLPVPAVHDEFAYLLAGETYSLGRVTNPTHPFWRHFETLHVFHEPTYQAKYPPAQGIVLAMGFLLGLPIVGVWLSLGLACGAVCWALQTSLPRRWAFLAGILCVGSPWIIQRWGSTYWGGAVAMLGGALLFGGALRLARRPGLNGAIPTAAGLALLANSRPFEGLILTLAVASCFGLRIFRSEHRNVAAWRASATVIGAVMLLTFLGMLSYNGAVTGDSLRMPYVHHEEKYAVAPSFLWQAERPVPEYRHEALRSVHLGWECQPYRSARRDVCSFFRWWFWKLQLLWNFLIGAAMGVALVALPAALTSPLSRIAAGSLGLVLGSMTFHTYMQAHYAAPATVLVVLLLVQSLRALRTFRWNDRSTGRTLVRCLVLIQLFSLVPFYMCHWRDHERFASADSLRQRFEEQADRRDFDYLTASAASRARLDGLLRLRAKKSLVLVRCGPHHDHLVDWVYNAPDIDAAPVIWARALDRASNSRLREYFADRETWLLVVDGGLPRLFRFADSSRSDGVDRLAPVSWLSD